MKHWTEPNGILLIKIPIEWQYRNAAIEGGHEKSPYCFELYDEAIGCFQLSCYQLAELAPNFKKNISKGNSIGQWTHSRMDSEEFDTHLFFGAIDDQALIAKYIYSRELRGNENIQEQLKLVETVLGSVTIVPVEDRKLAADLDKYDSFLASLAGSYDLLYSALESESFIEIIIVSSNQIDAFLRMCIVIAKQLQAENDEIDTKYIFQGANEKALLERTVFDHALELGVIKQTLHNELSELYKLRNQIVHRYIISSIKTRDMISIVAKYLEMSEKIRLVLRSFEDLQIGKSFGVYGRGFVRADLPDEIEARRVHSWANDKHLLEKFKRTIKLSEI